MRKSEVRVNPKLIHRIIGGTGAILSDQFTEVDIRELLIDLREIIREMHKTMSDIVKEEYLFLLDICDTIAHPHRDRELSPLVKQIQTTSTLMQERLRQNNLIMIPEFDKSKCLNFALPTDLKLANTKGLVFYLGVMIQSIFLLLKKEDKFHIPFEKFMERQADIALCVFSLLQHVTLHIEYEGRKPVDDGEHGFLYLYCKEKTFHLYFRSSRTKLEKEAQQRAIAKGVAEDKLGSASLDFVVLEGLGSHDDGTFVNIETMPAVLETYRDENNVLGIRKCVFAPFSSA